MTRPYTIWPLRFSPNPDAMIEFFDVLGLHKAISHADRTYASFDGRSGKLGVHSAARTVSGPVPTHTTLNFTTADVTAAAEELTAAGLPVQVWDETYGKQGVVTTPTGLAIGFNEDTQDDLYGGYQAHEHTVTAQIDVVADCTTDDLAQDAASFASFGFTADSLDDPCQVRLRAEGRSGVLRAGAIGPVCPHAGRARIDAQFAPRRSGPPDG
jgi:hypothetical protein